MDADRPDFAGAVIVQVDLRKHARYRYGDTGEFFMKYGAYYSQAASTAGNRQDA